MSQTYWWTIRSSDSMSGLDGEPEFREVVHREVSFEAEGDGRTLFTRIVPYNTPTQVADPPNFEPYTEVWKPGVFDKQLKAANRVDVLLNFEHEKGIGGVVGRGTELRSEPDGLLGTFRLLANHDGEKTRELVHEKVLTGMSLEAVVLKSNRAADGSIERTEARLRNVAICRNPAFPGAEVLAVRTEGEDEPDEPAPDEPDPEEPEPQEPGIIVPELVVRDDINELLERVGIEPLLKRATTSKPWDGSPARFEDAEYERSALICRAGDAPPKERCSLPVLEPNGDLNTNALGAAASRLNQVTGISGAERAAAARRLVRYYRQVGQTPPASVLSVARR